MHPRRIEGWDWVPLLDVIVQRLVDSKDRLAVLPLVIRAECDKVGEIGSINRLVNWKQSNGVTAVRAFGRDIPCLKLFD